MGVTTDPRALAVAAESSVSGSGDLSSTSSDTKYYIYSSKAGKTPSTTVQVLTPDTNTDNFVSSLKNQVIILESAPSPVANLDRTDGWSQWMSKLDTGGKFSVKVDDTTQKSIQSFDFKFSTPWNVTFSSSTAALNFSFGAPPEIGGDQARVPVPGLPPDGAVLYCGLNASQTTVLKSTVKDVFGYVGLSGMVSYLPSSVSGLSVTLDPANASKKHNALWFNPLLSSETTFRLQFQLDIADKLQKVLNFALPGFVIQNASVICKRVLVAGITETGPAGIDKGEVSFSVQCSVTPKNNPAVNMIAGIEYQESAVTLTFQFDSPDSLPGILLWLGGLITDDLGPVQDLLKKESIFKHFNLRRMAISLDSSEDPEKPKLSSFGIDIEVSANFGQGSEQKPVVFLVTYNWTKDGGKLGGIRGDLWNWFDTSKDLDLSPYYEVWTDLQPVTSNPASSLNLISMIPGQSVENVPSNIPTEITRAYISLSDTTFSIGGTIQSGPVPQASVPQINLGLVRFDASYTWGKASAFRFSFGIMVGIQPGTKSTHQDPAVLIGSLDYDSSQKTWELKATLDGLYASTLYEFFDSSSADHVIPLIESIEIANMTLNYKYTGKNSGPSAGGSVGSYFKFTGLLLVAGLELDLMFEYKDDWTFTAQLKPQNKEATLGDIIASILGNNQLDLPDFLANMKFGGEGGTKDTLRIDVHKEKVKAPASTGTPGGSFHFIAEVALGPLALTFAQYHASNWSAGVPSKRMVKVALTEIKDIDIPLVGNITQPFDEMYYMWVQDSTNQNKTKVPGLTRRDIRELNTSLSDQLVPKDKFKNRDDSDVLISAGSHFAVIIKNSSGQRTCILDYDFKKQASKPPPGSRSLTAPESSSAEAEGRAITAAATDQKDDSSGSSASAPFKKKAGPLSISNIGLKYSDKKLRIMFDATFELGPLGFSLIGFSINLEITSLDKVPGISAGIQGLSAAFEKPPLTIAGIIRHGNTGTLDYYAGGLIIGFVPYQFQAAGFYGQATPEGAPPFTSVFIFARLDGPLVTLEFAEISGVTGGFGYKSDVRIPTADQVVNFPFIATHTLDGATSSVLKTLERLTSPEADGWFRPLDNTYWAAAGLKVDAFQMIALDAVVVVQFGQSIKLGIFAVALADIPTAKSPVKYAHVELGIAVVVDFDYGILKVEAQLSPNSYILHPDCHLTGGFGLYYWFDAPHADKSNVGSFVFTLGGYHQAFKVPDGYPNPPRLGISWSLGSNLSITGQAYFAITPKACMGGGRLHASFSAGPITAWFDAFADFLINYKPFHFMASAGISVGVRFDIDIWFIHTHISVEISAELYLWGPPVAGRVHVDFWITSFDINFGDSDTSVPPITLIEFYELVLQTSSQTNSPKAIAAAAEERITDVTSTVKRQKNEGHVFLAQSGLMNNSEVPEREQNATWTVRGGTFSFVVGCKMAINTAKRGNSTINYTTNDVYSKPMKLKSPMSSTLTVEISQDGVPQDDAEWGVDKYVKSVPTGLWAKYNPKTDPSGGNNHIDTLLNSQDGGVPLLMGVLLTAPPPTMSADNLPTFNIEDADLQELRAEKNFPPPEPSLPEWEPDTPSAGAAQWEAVRENWKTPVWGTGEDGQSGFVAKWAEAFRWDSGALTALAAIPKRLEKRFDDLYVAAPLMTK